MSMVAANEGLPISNQLCVYSLSSTWEAFHGRLSGSKSHRITPLYRTFFVIAPTLGGSWGMQSAVQLKNR
jgi:hypothetical protein